MNVPTSMLALAFTAILGFAPAAARGTQKDMLVYASCVNAKHINPEKVIADSTKAAKYLRSRIDQESNGDQILLGFQYAWCEATEGYAYRADGSWQLGTARLRTALKFMRYVQDDSEDVELVTAAKNAADSLAKNINLPPQ